MVIFFGAKQHEACQIYIRHGRAPLYSNKSLNIVFKITGTSSCYSCATLSQPIRTPHPPGQTIVISWVLVEISVWIIRKLAAMLEISHFRHSLQAIRTKKIASTGKIPSWLSTPTLAIQLVWYRLQYFLHLWLVMSRLFTGYPGDRVSRSVVRLSIVFKGARAIPNTA